MSFTSDTLSGRTVLVVEEERFLAGYIASAIVSAGGIVEGPFQSTAQALARLSCEVGRPDAASLNITVRDGSTCPLADELARTGTPYLFASAHDRSALPDRFSGSPVLTKPFAAYQVVQALAALLEQRRPA